MNAAQPRHGPRGVVALAALGLVSLVLLSPASLRASPPEVSPLDHELLGPGVNVDDPCFWVDPVDPAASLVFVTAKDSGLVEVFNVVSGAFVATIPGFGLPNNCAVEGDLLLTTDRGIAHDVKVHHLPDLAFVGSFGADMLTPEGIDVLTTPEGERLVYVTDSNDASVHVYALDTGTLVRSFPTGFGGGIEPIFADDRYQRVYVVRGEKESTRGVGLFTPEGTKVEEFGANVFSKDGEGIAVYACGDGGYLVIADQTSSATQFEVFDRVTLTHFGTFRMQDGAGEFTNSTDGLDILQTPLPGFPDGLLAACDGCGSGGPDELDVVGWGRIAAVMGLDVCPGGAPPDCVTAPCRQRVIASADAFVASVAPAANFGTDATLQIEGDPVNGTRETLVRFEVPDLGDLTVEQATLRLTVSTQSGSDSTMGGTLFASEGPWDEDVVTFTSRPASTGDPIASAGPVASSQAVDFDVTPLVGGPGGYDFILRSASTNLARYRSREAGESPPALLLTVRAPAPPPSTTTTSSTTTSTTDTTTTSTVPETTTTTEPPVETSTSSTSSTTTTAPETSTTTTSTTTTTAAETSTTTMTEPPAETSTTSTSSTTTTAPGSSTTTTTLPTTTTTTTTTSAPPATATTTTTVPQPPTTTTTKPPTTSTSTAPPTTTSTTSSTTTTPPTTTTTTRPVTTTTAAPTTSTTTTGVPSTTTSTLPPDLCTPAPACNDGDHCTADACEPAIGCVHADAAPDDVTRALCRVENVRDLLHGPRAVCTGGCPRGLERNLDRVRALIVTGTAAPTPPRCRRSLRAARAAAHTLESRLVRLARRADPIDARRLIEEARRLAERANALASTSCVRKSTP